MGKYNLIVSLLPKYVLWYFVINLIEIIKGNCIFIWSEQQNGYE